MKMFSIIIVGIVLLILGTGYILTMHISTPVNLTDSSTEEEIYPNALYPVRVKGRWGYMNSRKEIVIDCQYEAAEDFTGGLASVTKKVRDKGGHTERELVGFIDEKGAVVADFLYDKAYAFSEGMAIVIKDELYGFIDSTGKEVIPTQFEDAASFSEGLAAVKVKGKNGFINKRGEMVIALAFERSCHGSVFSDGLAPVYTTMEEGTAGYIDKTGTMVIGPKFGFVDQFFEGLAMVRPLESNEFGYINTKGEWVIKPAYDLSLGFHEGLATVKEMNNDGSSTFAIIDKTGKELAKNMKYNFVGIFKEGLAAFENVNFQWGYIDRSGKEVIPAQFASPKFFINGLARVETGSFFGELKIVYINKKGQIVWKEK
jgi:hypothetical protein